MTIVLLACTAAKVITAGNPAGKRRESTVYHLIVKTGVLIVNSRAAKTGLR